MAQEHRITEEILKKTLANKHEAHLKDIQLKDFTASEGSNKGDGYACEMKKVEVTSEIRAHIHKDTFIYKCIPMGEEMMRFIREVLIFRIETTFYMDILPQLSNLAKQHNLQELSVPKTYFGDEEEGVLAMQSLRDLGFIMKGKDIGLSVPDMKLFLRELAKLHGLSYQFIESYFGGVERFKKDYWFMNGSDYYNKEGSKYLKMIDDFMKITFAQTEMVVEESPEHKHLLEPLKEFTLKRHWLIKHEAHAPKGSFNCLIHNDAWCNNVMFKDSSRGSAIDICLIDFQGIRRARPTVDLVYCLLSSMAPEVRKAHLDELLRYYHKELINLLTRLGYSQEVYSFKQLKEDFQDTFPHGFAMGLTHALLQGTDPNAEDNLDIQKLFSDGSEEALQKLNDFLREQARVNQKMKQKILHLVEEAREMKVI